MTMNQSLLDTIRSQLSDLERYRAAERNRPRFDDSTTILAGLCTFAEHADAVEHVEKITGKDVIWCEYLDNSTGFVIMPAMGEPLLDSLLSPWLIPA